MQIEVRAYTDTDLPEMIRIWNRIVKDGIAFPQEEELDNTSGKLFFAEQSHNGVAVDEKTGEVLGLYILHPNNVGRCGHICNASYAVDKKYRGLGIGKQLVLDSLQMGKVLGFQIMQFNAVVDCNIYAKQLYESLGFQPLGTIPKGFRMKDGHFEDICPYYYEL